MLHPLVPTASHQTFCKPVTELQVPTVVLAYIPPGEASGEATPEGATKLQLQPFPGPLKYAYLAGWLTMAAQELK